MLKRDIALQIKELMERYHGDIYSVASKMHMDPVTLQQWVDMIADILK